MISVEERETTIGWYADEAMATVYTSFRPMVTRLRRICGAERVEVHRTKAGRWTGETWRVPVAYVQIRPPRRVSESQREAARRLMRVRLRKHGSAPEFSTQSGHSGGGPRRETTPLSGAEVPRIQADTNNEEVRG